jgi:hypothetical protein
LVLPLVETMTPPVLRKIKQLVEDGATVVAPWPVQKAPGLGDYPACDAEVKALAAELWGDGPAPREMTERRVGKGRILWGGELSPTPPDVLDETPNLGSAKWIWYKEGNPAISAPPGKRYFRRVVTLPADGRVASARLAMTVDNEFICYVNGRRVGSGDNFTQAYVMDVASALKPGENLIAVDATNTTDLPNPAGLIGSLTVKLRDGRTISAPTDASWQSSMKAAAGWNINAKLAEGWSAALALGPLGMAPWGNIEAAPVNPEIFPPMTLVYQWLVKAGVPPDFSANRPLRYIHRRLGDADVYFVANGAAEGCEATVSLRIAGKQPELWHPESGCIAPLPVYEEKDGCTRLPLRLGPTESVFIVFRRPADPAARIVSATRDGRELLSAPALAAGAAAALDLARGEIWQPGVYLFKTADGRSREIRCPGLAAPRQIGGPWEVAFDPKWGGPAKITFEKLVDWSKRPEEGVKYYSGAASYRTTFHVAADSLEKAARWYLDLGKVAVMAEVRLNGKPLGIVWKPPYRADVSGLLQPGENVLEVKVVNLWINRQIGDEQLPDDCDRNPDGTLKAWPKWVQEGKPSPTGRYTFSSWKLWKKGDPLQESGLLGPVTLLQAVQIPR